MSGFATLGALEREGVLSGARQSAVVAAGNSQATATKTGAAFAIVSGADGTKGIQLISAKVGGRARGIANTGGSALVVYPPVGGSLNGLAANTSVSIPANKAAILYNINGNSGVNWIMIVGA